MDEREREIDRAVKAWRSAAETYTEVFEQLAAAAATMSTDGMSEGHPRVEFDTMAKTARAALEAVQGFVLYETRGGYSLDNPAENGGVSDEEDNDSEDDSDGSGESDGVDDNEVVNHTRLPSVGQKEETKGKPANAIWLKRVGIGRGKEWFSAPYATLGSSEKKAWKAERSKQRREKKRLQRAAKRSSEARAGVSLEDISKPLFERDPTSLNGLAEQDPIQNAGNAVPKVEYEDVSAEVEARLKIKEEKKAAAKKEKKRKRDSEASLELIESNGKSNGPTKKKSKADHAAQVINATAHGEQKKHSREADEHADNESRKKRRR